MESYTLYDIYTIHPSCDTLYEYESISNRMLMIGNLYDANLLDADTRSVVEDYRFRNLISVPISVLKQSDMYSPFIYEVDLILLELDTQSSKNLILKYGSLYAYNLVNLISSDDDCDMYDHSICDCYDDMYIILPLDIIEQIILKTDDINTIISYYCASTHCKKFIDKNLSIIMHNVIYSIPKNNLLIGNMRHSNFSKIYEKKSGSTRPKNFRNLIIRYYNVFNYFVYTTPDKCNDDTIIMFYSTALLRHDTKGAEILMKRIKQNIKNGMKYNLLKHVIIPISHAVNLVKEIPYFTDNTQDINRSKNLSWYFLSHASRKHDDNITDDELDQYDQLLHLTNTYTCESLYLTVDFPKLFVYLYGLFVEKRININVYNVFEKFRQHGINPSRLLGVHESLTTISDKYKTPKLNAVNFWNVATRLFLLYLNKFESSDKNKNEDNRNDISEDACKTSLDLVREFVSVTNSIGIDRDTLHVSLIKIRDKVEHNIILYIDTILITSQEK